MNTRPAVRQRNHRKRLFGWIFFYILLFAAFIAVVYLQGEKVNTLQLPNGQIQLTTSKSKYTVGDTVSFSLKNNFSTPIYLVNKCPQEPLHVYQYKNSSWQRIHDQAGANACSNTPAKITIPAGGTVTKNYASWPHLFGGPGIYRLVAYADNYPNIAYADFQVVAPPPKPLAAPSPIIIYKPVYTPVYTPIYIPAPSGGGGGDN